MRWRGAILSAFLVAGLAVFAVAEDLGPRVDKLLREGRYDLALAILEDNQQRGVELTERLAWTRARLVPDADRFDRLASQLAGGRSVEDTLVQSIVVERARQQFARGQYLTCLENLRSLPPDAASRHVDLVLFRAMAAQAVGEAGPATRDLESLSSDHPHHAIARALLADLALRAGQARRALDLASTAVASDASVGAQAHYVAWQAHRQLGDEEGVARAREALVRDYPRSVEAAWVRESRTAPLTRATDPDVVPEVEAPARRIEFALQLGAFRDRSLALRLASEREGVLPELRVERDEGDRPGWYRVVGGRYATRGQADAALARLRATGLDAVVLAPGRER